MVLKELPPSQLAQSSYAENNATRPFTCIHTTSDQFVNGPAALPLNSWFHLAVTCDGGWLRLFLNGAPIATRTVSGVMAAGQGALRIGGTAVWGEHLRGLIERLSL